jgi:transcriptional regulator
VYLPASFRVDDEPKARGLIQDHPFATVVTPTPEQLWVSHVPMLARPGAPLVLAGHVARANGHWRAMGAGAPTTAIFHGPHAYVSPTWYATSPAVPTWNYAVVHATGSVALLEDEASALESLSTLSEAFEGPAPEAWRTAGLPDELRRSLVGAIVAFELRVERIEAKLKLGQNRSPADRLGVIARLEADGDETSRALAAHMRATLR